MIRNVDDVVTTAPAAVEAVFIGVRMVSDVEVVVPAVTAGLLGLRVRHPAGPRILSGATLDERAQVIDLSKGSSDGREEQHPTTRVLIDKDVVETTRHQRLMDSRDLTHRGRIGKTCDVEHYRAEVRVRSTLTKLERLHHVVAVVPLEVLHVHPAQAQVEILVLDAPLVQNLRIRRILDADDVHALHANATVCHPTDVGIRTGHLLLNVHVRRV